VVAIDRLLLGKLDVLETMSPEGFLEFRDPLAPASGFQSSCSSTTTRGCSAGASTTR
jgi:tryptophan 2,3-dioxygenase